MHQYFKNTGKNIILQFLFVKTHINSCESSWLLPTVPKVTQVHISNWEKLSVIMLRMRDRFHCPPQDNPWIWMHPININLAVKLKAIKLAALSCFCSHWNYKRQTNVLSINLRKIIWDVQRGHIWPYIKWFHTRELSESQRILEAMT